MSATRKVLGVCLTGACLAACGATGRDDVQVTQSALVANQANVFGFEDPAHWTTTVTKSSSTNHTQGTVSLGVAARGYVLETGQITLSGAADALLADERVRKAGHGLGLRVDLRDGEDDVERSQRDDERRQPHERNQRAVQEAEDHGRQ